MTTAAAPTYAMQTITPQDIAPLLALNNAAVPHVNELETDAFQAIVGEAAVASESRGCERPVWPDSSSRCFLASVTPATITLGSVPTWPRMVFCTLTASWSIQRGGGRGRRGRCMSMYSPRLYDWARRA